MVRSMTGYGRGEAERDGMRMVVELKTVNHRFLEPSIRMSRELLALENDLKEQDQPGQNRCLYQFRARGGRE